MTDKELWQEIKPYMPQILIALVVITVLSIVVYCSSDQKAPITSDAREQQELRYEVDQLKAKVDDYARILQEYNAQHMRNEESLMQDITELHSHLDKSPDRRETN